MRNIAEALVAIAETEEQVYQAGYFNGYLAGEGNAPDIELDSTLTQEGMAADAKAVGDALDNKMPLSGEVNLQSPLILKNGNVCFEDVVAIQSSEDEQSGVHITFHSEPAQQHITFSGYKDNEPVILGGIANPISEDDAVSKKYVDNNFIKTQQDISNEENDLYIHNIISFGQIEANNDIIFNGGSNPVSLTQLLATIENTLDEVLELQNNYLAPDGDEVSY